MSVLNRGRVKGYLAKKLKNKHDASVTSVLLQFWHNTVVISVILQYWPHYVKVISVILQYWPHYVKVISVILQYWPHYVKVISVILQYWPHYVKVTSVILQYCHNTLLQYWPVWRSGRGLTCPGSGSGSGPDWRGRRWAAGGWHRAAGTSLWNHNTRWLFCYQCQCQCQYINVKTFLINIIMYQYALNVSF